MARGAAIATSRRGVRLLVASLSGFALGACDAQLSRFDRVTVTPGATPVEPGAVAREVAASGASPSPSSASPATATAGGTSSVATSSATATATGTATAADTGAPTAATGLATTAGAAGVADERYAASASLLFAWTAASGGAGILNYTLTWYSQPACAGTGTDITGITGTSKAFAGTSGQTYSFKVTAFDHAGKAAASTCSGAIAVDTAGPTLSATQGASVWTNDLTVTFANPAPPYQSIDVRRGTSASGACDGGFGPIVRTLQAADVVGGASLSATDYADAGEAQYYYVACLHDAAGNVAAGPAAGPAKTKPNILFATGNSYGIGVGANLFSGLTGSNGADAVCQATAHPTPQAGQTAAVYKEGGAWVAVLSSSTVNARDRLTLAGPVLTADGLAGHDVAASADALWTNVIDNQVYYQVGSPFFLPPQNVWTGSSNSGEKDPGAAFCSDWGDSTSLDTPIIGDATDNSNTIFDVGTTTCGATASIYCMSQPFAVLAPAPAGAAATVTLTLQLPANVPISGHIAVHRSAAAGSSPATTLTDADCSATTDLVGSYAVTPGDAAIQVTDAGAGVSAPALITGDYYTYLACVFDSEGNVIMGYPSTTVVAP